MEQPAACLDLLALAFTSSHSHRDGYPRSKMLSKNQNLSGSTPYPPSSWYPTKTACQSNALCSLIKQTGLLMFSPATLGVRLLRGPSLAPVACAGKTWLTWFLQTSLESRAWTCNICKAIRPFVPWSGTVLYVLGRARALTWNLYLNSLIRGII